MSGTSEFKTKTTDKVTELRSQNYANGDIMKAKIQEEQSMEREIYTKTEIDLKLDKINSDVKHGFEKVDLKFDQVRTEMRDGFENMGLRMEKCSLISNWSNKKRKKKTKNG